MNFINGVVLVKEVVTLSIFGSCLAGTIVIVLTVISFGGLKLYINGYRNFSDGMKIIGVIMCIVGIILMISFMAFINNNNFISFADSLGLGITEHTGEYEVTVTVEADMNEFQEQYEILDYENGVYTIKLK